MRRNRVLAITLAAFAAAAVTVSLARTVPFPLPGATNDVQSAAVSGQGATVEASAQSGDVRVAVLGVVADSTETILSVRIAGSDSAGSHASFGPTFLVSAAGEAVPLGRSSSDPASPRSFTLVFPSFADPAGMWTLRIDSIDFYDDPGSSRSVRTDVRVTFEPAISIIPAPQVSTTSPKLLSVGAASVTLDSITFAPTGLVVAGHIAGFAPDEIGALDLMPTLTTADGRAVRLQSGRSGFGDGNALFEFRFPATSGIGNTFALAFAASHSPVLETLAPDRKARIALTEGQVGKWTFDSP